MASPSPTAVLFLAASAACLSAASAAAAGPYEVVYWKFYSGGICSTEIGEFTTASGQCLEESYMLKAVSSGHVSAWVPQSLKYTCGGNAKGTMSYGVFPTFFPQPSCGGLPYVVGMTGGKGIELEENKCIASPDGLYSYKLACGITTPTSGDTGLAVQITNDTRSIAFAGGECQFGGLDTNGDLITPTAQTSFKIMCTTKSAATIQHWSGSNNCTGGTPGAVVPINIPGGGGGGPGTGGEIPTTEYAWPNGKIKCIEVTMASSEKNETKDTADKDEGKTSSGSGGSSGGLSGGAIAGIIIAIIVGLAVVGGVAYHLGKSTGISEQNERSKGQLLQVDQGKSPAGLVPGGTADVVGGYHLHDERGL